METVFSIRAMEKFYQVYGIKIDLWGNCDLIYLIFIKHCQLIEKRPNLLISSKI